MNELRSFYIKWMKIVAGIALTIAFAGPVIVSSLNTKFGNSSWLVWITTVLTHKSAIVILIIIAEFIVRKWWWRKLHPELDFSGKWVGHTKYTHVHVGAAPVGIGTGQEVRIEQDCLKLRLIPSEGLDFVFRSRAIDIQDGGTNLVYAYHVQYAAETKDRPLDAYGYESLEVVETTSQNRPQKLKGWFAQCARGQQPVFSGDVELVRAKI